MVLEQDQRRGRVVRNVLEDVPRILIGEDVDAVRRCLCARNGAGRHPFFALDSEADKGTYLAADLYRFVLGEVAEMLDFDFSVAVFVDGQRVDHSYRAGFP